MQLPQAFGWFGLVLSLVFGQAVFSSAALAKQFQLSEWFRSSLLAGLESSGSGPNDLLGLECQSDDGRRLPMMNNVVLDWKTSTSDQYVARALVKGPITNIVKERDSHMHFAINLDSDGSGDLEVIYNKNFGELPRLQVGMTVTACGDYITARKTRPSPLGALIHWVHYNPGDRDGGKHKHGFLIINNQPYGVSAKQMQQARTYMRQR